MPVPPSRLAARVIQGDCLDVLPTLGEGSVDAVVTDPPYGLSFMGKQWDHGVPGVAFWDAVGRVLKPGGYMLAMGGTRTYHRLACAVEDAGFEVRDCLMWVYGTGFPKSLDVSKAIDKAAGAAREVVGVRELTGYGKANVSHGQQQRFTTQFAQTSDTAATDAARQWAGWGTALKPAWEPIIVARKPLRGTVAANVQAFGTGALNIGACRITAGDPDPDSATFPDGARNNRADSTADTGPRGGDPLGRWPANVIHDGSEEVLEAFAAFGESKPRPGRTGLRGGSAVFGQKGIGSPDKQGTWPEDAGGTAARFFYCAKASKADRDEGLEDLPTIVASVGNTEAAGRDGNNPKNYIGHKKRRVESGLPATTPRRNTHPTVKPTALMEWLVKLVCPVGGTVLDPFCGSGSTGKACVRTGRKFIGVESDPEYVIIARKRIV